MVPAAIMALDLRKLALPPPPPEGAAGAGGSPPGTTVPRFIVRSLGPSTAPGAPGWKGGCCGYACGGYGCAGAGCCW
ncbi:hypothetical protein GCM10009801_47730 [Streptomyces albiaxialis]|uniref:Uncharacterized protein n=1 Tax=Streptomyces albiaxialis TaxID=329523 RepID=A0ABN2W7K8_9ACTN